FTVMVQDTTPPTVSVPPDIVDSTTNASGKPETFTVTAVDLVDGARTPSCSPLSSGATFPVGTTKVTCTATDTRGSSSAPASFTVVVNLSQQGDTTPPVVTVPADIDVPAASAAGAPVSFTVTATDPDDPVTSIDCTPPSGSTFPVGITTVSCTATDSHG